MPLTLTAAFVTLAAVDLATLVQFYGQLLNQPPSAVVPNVYAEFQLPGVKLGIFRPRNELKSARSAPAAMSLCLEVENLAAAIAHLTQLGYPPEGEIKIASHGREIHAYDPEGNGLILHQSTQADGKL